MERFENESYLQFVERASQALISGLIDYKEWSEAVIGKALYSEETLRRIFNFFNNFIEKLDAEEIKTLNGENRLEEIQKAKEEFYKENCKLRDTIRAQHSALREEARFETLCETLKDSIKLLPKLPDYGGWCLPDTCETKTAILCLSDWHCGMVIDNAFNYYDVQTMKDRANVIIEKAIGYCCEHCVTDLIVEVNGDMVDGDVLISSRVQQEQDVVQQVVTVSEVLSECIAKLTPWFDSVKVYCTLGNHGRLKSNKKDCITKENFEMLIPEFLKLRLRDFDNVKVIDSKGQDFMKYNIGDKVICIAHGQNDSLARVVEDFSKIFKQIPSEIHLGHYHSYRDLNDCDILINVNGSLCGANDYALRIRKVCKPSQSLIIYDNDRCVYCLDTEI